MVIWTPWKALSFLWGDGYDPWSQYATSTVNLWPLHHHWGCFSNGWRSSGGSHERLPEDACLGPVMGRKVLQVFFLCVLLVCCVFIGENNSFPGRGEEWLVGGGRWGGVVFCKCDRTVRKQYQHLCLFLFLLLHNVFCHLQNKGGYSWITDSLLWC